MKQYLWLTLLIAVLANNPYEGLATTYSITSNTTWTAVVGSTNCWTCTFNITPGKTFTLNYSGTCGTCTFNNGNLNITQNLTCQGCSFTTDTITASGVVMNLQSTTNTFTNTFLTMSGAGEVEVTAGMSVTNSNFVFTNTSYFFADGGTVTFSNSTVTFKSSSYLLANAGPISLKNNTDLVAGDGTLASTAYLNFNGPTLNIYDNSLIKVSNQNNYYANWGSYTYYPTSGGSTSYSTTSNNLNCNYAGHSGYANSCVTNYVYGCATMNGSGMAACSILAVADLSLTAKESGPTQVALTWTDNESTPADHYSVERSTGNNQWTAIGNVAAHTYVSAEYQFTDEDAPAGMLYYRIERIDADNGTLYSPISTISLSPVNATIGIHPNPASGGYFYLSTSSAESIIVNVFTSTGQLLLHTVLQGQTQYPIQLPTQGLSLTAIVVQTIGANTTRSFTVLVR